jgi:membrane fusion protein, macrolide-specific efflux system
MREFLKRHTFVVVLWSLVILVGTGYGVHLWSNKPQSSSPQTTKVTKTTLTQTISASGQVASSGQVSVTTQASGKVTKVYVQVGQTVKKGDKILDIDKLHGLVI